MQIKVFLIPPSLEAEKKLEEIMRKTPEIKQAFQAVGSPLNDYILLNTVTFDDMPLQNQEHIKKALEGLLRRFANNLLAAVNFYFASKGQAKEAINAIEEGLKLMDERLDRVSKEIEKQL